jgi:alpha-mannosidase
MRRTCDGSRVGALITLSLCLPAVGFAADDTEPMFDLSKEKVLYCIGYAHLDTQWRWDFTTTIDRYIRDTLDDNFDRFDKYPGYVFNFTGSVRYRMMQEYYPEKFEQLKRYIEQGRWHVSGSSVDEGDVNVPSAEAVIRQVLYGNDYFRREFGKQSVDFMLPDCFGFPASMPSIWAHCGLEGFSTQKLTWGSAVGIPFPIGVWEGLDGRSVIAAFDPGSYGTGLSERVDTHPKWVERVTSNGKKYGVWADYHYYGVGDQGGAPREEHIANYLASIGNPDGKIRVALTSSDQMFKDITDEQRMRLPRYRGDLLLTEHSAGTLTSQAYMKRWNRKNEILADAAERAAVIADWLGAAPYPLQKLNRSWERVLANQMHDILPGTSIPRAYRFSWNDEIVAANGFAAVVTDSVGAVAQSMNTNTTGQPIIVYNPLATARDDLVQATVLCDQSLPAVRVFDAVGREVPSQVLSRAGNSVTVLFPARVAPVSLTVFDVRPSETHYADANGLHVSKSSMENEHYRVSINASGDVAGILDKESDRELLAAPAQLVFTHERPMNWPAWNMDWADRQNPPIEVVKGPAKIRIVENGPVRVALEVQREARNSIIIQQIRLARGAAGKRVELKSTVDWQSTECILKASFPLTASNPKATYNWGMGTIQRGNNEPTKYEVPSHEWFDLTDESGDFGVSILEDCKFGSDKPTDNEVRLTLLYTPGVRHSYLDQHSQDWGRHDFIYALYAHRGDWRNGRSEWQGRRLNQPLLPFCATKHNGSFGRAVSFLSVDTDQVDVRAIKRAEHGDWIIVRLQELWGRPAGNVHLSFNSPIAEAHEIDGQERRIGDAKTSGKRLVLDMTAYSPRSFAVRLAQPRTNHGTPQSLPITLPFNEDVITQDGDRSDGRFDAEGRSIPSEMLPRNIETDCIVFHRSEDRPGKTNAVACNGQKIDLPSQPIDRLYLLAAATEDVTGRFLIDDTPHDLTIQKWTGFVGQWDDRIWDREFDEVDHRCEGNVIGIRPGYIKRDPIAWFCTHRHHPDYGNDPYRFSYLFKYALDLPPGAKSVTLPTNERIKILAMTAVRNDHDLMHPAAPLYDDFTDREPIRFRHVYPNPTPPVFEGSTAVADVSVDRKDSFAALSMGPPVSSDFADRSSANAVTFRYFDTRGLFRPHPASGAIDGVFPRLNDGKPARNDDDTERCVWYDGAGRFYVDLERPVNIRRINTYSWHRSNRAPQFFSLWGSDRELIPDPDIAADSHDGWTFLAVVNTKELGEGAIHGSSVFGNDRPLGPYRYVLWAVEDVGPGTFFTEIDIHAAD